MNPCAMASFLRPRKGDGILCKKHRTRDNDVWYDCEWCLEESCKWAATNGFTHCVSPGLARDGTDKGAWVQMKRGRWVNNEGRV